MTESTSERATAALDPAHGRPAAPNTDCSLDALTTKLAPLLKGGATHERGAEVAALLREYAGCEQSWRQYEMYCDDTYSRNLIWRSEDFELLLLCWDAGQESPIHDHAGQHCWMAVLDGDLEEVHYRVNQDGGLSEGRVKAYETGGVAFIDDDIALHLIRPQAGKRGVSLHLYSNPIDTCHIFCPDTGQKSEVHVGYHSVRGATCAREDAPSIRTAWQCGDGAS